MKRFIALLAICVVGMLFGAVPLKWTVDAEKVTPVAFDAYHGETLAFEATLKSYGKVIPGVSNAVLYHQTNGMGNVWWQTSASVSNGIVKASFTPAMDTGADRVAFFLGVTDAAGSNYRASGQIRFKPSPGFNPITLDVPAMQRLNLSQVEVVGAPWATMADIDAVFARKSDIPEIPDMSEFATADLIERWGMGVSGEVGSLESTMHFRLDELQREVRDIPPPPDLSPYALRSELPVVPDLTGYATHGDVATNVANAAENLNDRISSLNEQLSAISDSVTSNAVAIANVSVNVDLTNYAQLSDIPDAPDLSHLATHDEVATNVAQMAEQLRVEMANITPAPDMTGYARLEDIPPAADLTNYAQLSDIPDAPDLSHLATHDEVATNVAQMAEQINIRIDSAEERLNALDAAISNVGTGAAPEVDLTGYARLEDIPDPTDLTGYATAGDVSEAVGNVAAQIGGQISTIGSNVVQNTDAIASLNATVESQAIQINENKNAIKNLPTSSVMTNFVKWSEIPTTENLADYVTTNQLVSAVGVVASELNERVDTVVESINDSPFFGFVGEASPLGSLLDQLIEIIGSWGVYDEISAYDGGELSPEADLVMGAKLIAELNNGTTSFFPNMMTGRSARSLVSEMYVSNRLAATNDVNSGVRTIDGKFNEIDDKVEKWESYWSGDDAILVITNYFGGFGMPSLSIMQKTPPDASHMTVYYKEVWNEMTRWNRFMMESWGPVTNAIVNYLAERPWGIYNSATGNYAPDGVLEISQDTIQISPGASWQKTIVSGSCSVWVLTSNDPEAFVPDKNGFIRLEDGDGKALFEIIKGDKRTVYAKCTQLSGSLGTGFDIEYSTKTNKWMTKCPKLSISPSLEKDKKNWKEEGVSTLASVTWSRTPDAWVAHVQPVQGCSKMFFKADYEVGGETYMKYNAPISVGQLYINGTNFNVHVDTATIDGVPKKILVLED